jgi:hypothetical protein
MRVVILGKKSAMGDRTHRKILANNFQLFLKNVISHQLLVAANK